VNDLWQLAFALVVLVVIAEAIAMLALARVIGVIEMRIGPPAPALQTVDGLAISAPAPDLTGFDLRAGREITLNVSRAGRWAVIFVSTTCNICREIVRELGGRKREDCFDATPVIVGRGTADQNVPLHKLVPDLAFVCDPLSMMHRAYSIDLAPFAFVVEDGRIVAKGIVNDLEQLRLLVEEKRAYVALDRPAEQSEPALAKA
jgi:hypothetical protein